jgi:hypothetical protein
MARELPPDEAPKRNRYIQWSQFDNGKAWRLERGTDFDRTPEKAALALRQWAYNHGRSVSVDVVGDGINFVIHPKPTN